MTPKATKITSKSNRIDPKMTTNPPNIGRHFGRVQILVSTPKTKKKKWRALRPVFLVFGTALLQAQYRYNKYDFSYMANDTTFEV